MSGLRGKSSPDVPVWQRSGPEPLRLAYADPPYPGQASEHYRDHPDYAGEVDHGELVERLMDEYPDGWEPVIVRQGRAPAAGLRDYLVHSPELYTFRPKPAGHVTGAKPQAFCEWVFRWLGAAAHDDLHDLFPGSGAVLDAWARFTAQPTLEAVG